MLGDLATENAVARQRQVRRPASTHLKEIGVGGRSPERAVIFAERVSTLHWLRDRLADDFKLKDDQVAILHGGISDVEQQEIVESFKQESSPIRVLVTGDVASEGVNLHLQCHELIHYDIPWSLIRIEQRNGRIDRYGQQHRPRITTLLLDPSTREVRRRHPGAAAAGREGARGPPGARRQRLADGPVRRQGRGGRDPRGARRPQGPRRRGHAASTRSAADGGIEGMLARLFAIGDEPSPEPQAEATPAGAAASTPTTWPSCATRSCSPSRPRQPPRSPTAGRRLVARAPEPRPGRVRPQQGPAPATRRAAPVLPARPQGGREADPGHHHRPRQRSRWSQRAAPSPPRCGPRRTTCPRCTPAWSGPPTGPWSRSGATSSSPSTARTDDASLLLHGTLTNTRGQIVASTFLVVTLPGARRSGVRPARAPPVAW